MGKSRLQIYFFHIRIIKNINCFQYDTQYIYIFYILFNTQNVSIRSISEIIDDTRKNVSRESEK